MLEQLLIFTRGGLILWSWRELGNALKESPIDALIQSCLLEGRAGDAVYQYFADGATYMLKWIFQNDRGLVFVAVYQRVLEDVDELLAMVECEFSKIYDPKRMTYTNFNDTFRQILEEVEERDRDRNKRKLQIKSAKVLTNESSGIANQNSGLQDKGNVSGKSETQTENDYDDKDSYNNGARSRPTSKGEADVDNAIGKVCNEAFYDNREEKDGGNDKHREAQFDINKLHNLRPRPSKRSGSVSESLKDNQGKKRLKRKRISDDMPQPSDLKLADLVDERTEEIVEIEKYTDTESKIGEEENQEISHSKTKGWFSFISQRIAGKRVFKKSDLDPCLKVLKDNLMAKNVAEEIADKLCESVAVILEGKEYGSFRRMCSTVEAALEEAILHILRTERSIDISKDVLAAKEKNKPYVILFVGVNGVGKSMNLAKVAYWLQQHDISVMMAACGTFGTGDVEKLRTHAHRLQIPIFEKEEEKDPAVVAKEAIQNASRNKLDVVLVDTADVMQNQDNVPLMRDLSNLINLNEPDLILYVGEALIGNDAMDQLSKLNQKLANLSTSGKARLIDGILLTNFDTVDEKVGATLSMVFISGAPVVFVGCGESYADLQKLNVKSIVKTLLK
uniref:SRP54-type proteins GTP-binding domain-containing protein n=2 Tax=Araucaria cunninghamii TaxID=56994 RepID=A0A0D6R849_ARACU